MLKLGFTLLITGVLIISFYFVIKKNLERRSTIKLQTEGLNFLLSVSYECFQHLIGIRQMIKNKENGLKIFLANHSIENAQHVVTEFAPPPLIFGINVGNYAFTVQNEPMICNLILKFLRTAEDIFGDIRAFNNQLKFFDGKELVHPDVLHMIQIQLDKHIPQILFKTNMGIYILFRLMEDVNYYHKFLGKNTKLLKFYDGDNVQKMVNEITEELNTEIGNIYWQRDFQRLVFRDISKFKVVIKLLNGWLAFRKFINKNDLVLVPTCTNYDLVTLEHYTMQANMSKLVTLNESYMHNFGMEEDLTKLGYAIQTEKGTTKIVLGNEFSPTLFRGQNNHYEKLSPNFLRIDKSKNPTKHCIEYIKREEFKRAFCKTPYYKFLPNLRLMGHPLEIDLDAIAQHYEFSTNYLDVTKDIRTALFFAYTKCLNGKYYPIDDFEKEKCKPVLYVANFANLVMLDKGLTAVGFQGVLRPLKQMAMAVDANADSNLISKFRKIDLPCDRAISHGIYNSFNKGLDLFPDEPIQYIRQIIINQTLLREDLFKEYCQKYNADENNLKEELLANGYRIQDWEVPVSLEMKGQVTKEIFEELIPWVKEKISYRRIFYQKNNKTSYFVDLKPMSIN